MKNIIDNQFTSGNSQLCLKITTKKGWNLNSRAQSVKMKLSSVHFCQSITFSMIVKMRFSIYKKSPNLGLYAFIKNMHDLIKTTILSSKSYFSKIKVCPKLSKFVPENYNELLYEHIFNSFACNFWITFWELKYSLSIKVLFVFLLNFGSYK